MPGGRDGGGCYRRAYGADARQGEFGQAVPKPEEGPWQICGLDAEGADLATGRRTYRVDFARPATSAEETRELLLDQLGLRAAQQ